MADALGVRKAVLELVFVPTTEEFVLKTAEAALKNWLDALLALRVVFL